MLTNQDKNSLISGDGLYENQNPFKLIADDNDTELQHFSSSSSTNNTTITYHTNSQYKESPLLHANHAHLKHSMSDDDILYNPNNENEHNSNDHDDDDDENEPFPKMTKLKLTDSFSEQLFTERIKQKRRKERSYSTSIPSTSGNKYQDKYQNLKKKFRNQSSQLQFYQDTITNIQDDAEELEEKLKREYELKLLHLETRYFQEKSQKNSLQHENERLRQQLFLREAELKRTLSGYSTATTNTTNNGNINTGIHLKRISTHSIHTITTNDAITSTKSPSSDHESTCSNQSSSASSTASTSSTSTSASTSSSASSSSADSSCSDDDDDDDGNMEDESCTDDEGQKYTKNVINTEPKYKSKEKGKHWKKRKKQRIPKGVQRKIGKNQPKGFWETVWSLFGPPDVMCSCSDKR